jgi:membrane protease YdiL (CAAX protease family)
MSELKRTPVLGRVAAFALLAYIWSAACWWPILDQIEPNLLEMSPGAIGLLVLGGLGPTLSAFAIAGVTGGRKGLHGLAARAMRWRAAPRYYLIAFLFAPLATLGGVIIYAALGHPVGAVRWDHWWVIGAFYLVAALLGPLLEETGWRGFAHPQLQERYGLLASGMAVGSIWTFWHAPLWLAAEGSSLSGGNFGALPLLTYWLFLCGQSIIAGWLVERAGGSVPVAMVVHQGVNAGAIGWLFYDIVEADKALVFEQLPVIAIWSIIAIFGLAHSCKSRLPSHYSGNRLEN